MSIEQMIEQLVRRVVHEALAIVMEPIIHAMWQAGGHAESDRAFPRNVDRLARECGSVFPSAVQGPGIARDRARRDQYPAEVCDRLH